MKKVVDNITMMKRNRCIKERFIITINTRMIIIITVIMITTTTIIMQIDEEKQTMNKGQKMKNEKGGLISGKGKGATHEQVSVQEVYGVGGTSRQVISSLLTNHRPSLPKFGKSPAR